MVFDEKVLTALEVLTDAAENDFELFRICTLVRDLIAPPKVEQVDEDHQRFDGETYYKTKKGYYVRQFQIHRVIWHYYSGDIPEEYEVHHDDWNPKNNDVSNLQALSPEEHHRIHSFRRPIAKKTFVCSVCGKKYEAAPGGTHLYCSSHCAEKVYSTRRSNLITVNCLCCGKPFTARADQNPKYCSLTCSAKAQYETTIQKTCPVCGETFEASLNHNKIYCSKKCLKKAWRSAAPNAGQAQVKRTCVICGKEFITRHRGESTAQTCSPSCSRKLAVKRQRKSQKSTNNG